jgi:3-oxoacyl-[acyl-carrier protein] reductase
MKLVGRTALVTGGSRGIGRAIVLALAEEGADVAINYVSSENAAREVAESVQKMGRRALLAQADVADYPDTFRMAQRVLQEFGHIDILVNNAGINSDKTFVKMDHASWRKVLAINLDGVFNCTKVFIDQMLKQNYGRVVNVTSVIGQIGNFGQANYAASKAGVAAFTKSLAKELAGKGPQPSARSDPPQALRAGGRGRTVRHLHRVLGRGLHHRRRAVDQRRPPHVRVSSLGAALPDPEHGETERPPEPDHLGGSPPGLNDRAVSGPPSRSYTIALRDGMTQASPVSTASSR